MEEVKVENELNLSEVKRENLCNSLKKIKSQSSDILVFSLQLSDLEDYLKSAEGKVENRFRELELKEVEFQSKSYELEERGKVVEAMEAKVSDLEMKADSFKREIYDKGEELAVLKMLVEECGVKERSQTCQLNEMVESLRKTQVDLDLKGQELVHMEIDLERYRGSVSVEMEHLSTTQTQRRGLEEEIEKKSKDLTLVQDKIVECGKLLEIRSSELMRTQEEVELKEKLLVQMKVDLERYHSEVNVDMEHLDRSRSCNRELEEELERKRKDLTVVVEKFAECEKQFELVEEKLDSQKKLLGTRSLELVSKNKELEVLSLDLDLREHTMRSLNTEMEEICQEMESKAKTLEDIEKLIEERIGHYESVKLLIEEHNEELEFKEKKQNEMTEVIRKLSLKIVSKEKLLKKTMYAIRKLFAKQHSEEKKLDSTKIQLKRCIADVESKETELLSVKDSFKVCLQNLEIKEKELKSLESLIAVRNKQTEEGEKKMEHLDSSNEELIRQLQMKQEEVCLINKELKECSDELECKKKHRDQVQSSITNLTAELKSKECDLNSVKKTIQDSLKDFKAKEEQQVRLKAVLMEREQELGVKEKQFDVRLKKIHLKEKELDAREEMIDKRDQQLKSRKQKLATCLKDYEQKAKKLSSICQQSLDVKPKQPTPEEPINNSSDQVSSHSANEEDALKDHDGSDIFSPNEVSSVLPWFKGSDRFVLTSVEDALMDAQQRGELSLAEPIIKTLVHLLEELTSVVKSKNPNLRSDAMKVAHRWSWMMRTSSQISPLEAWGFLQFMAAYGLVTQTNQEETLQFASHVAHFRQAPKLFQYLGLSYAIPNFVKKLLKEQQVLPAIRFVFFFNLKYIFSPLEFLKEEINKLRHSLKENRRFEPKVEDRDAGKLKEIIEVIEDFKLEIYLPVDLIIKFMAPRELQNQNQCVVLTYVPVQPPQILLPFHMQTTYPQVGGGSVQGQSLHHAGFKRPRMDHLGPGSRPAVRPCFKPPSGYIRF